MGRILLWLSAFVGLGSCVSRTVPSERFTASLSLSAPTNSVSVEDSRHFTFAAVGDLHIGSQDTSRLTRILSAAQAEGDAFVILLGDIVDKGDRENLLAV